MPNNNITSNILTPTTLLHQLYPDIEQQLCSRHSTLFGKLKQTFNKLYDNMQPSSYVVVKGSCQFVQQQLTEIGLSMALENGAIGLLSRTYGMSELFVNCNHFSEEVIFSHKGNIVQGLHPWVQQMQQIINLATLNRPQSQLYGGILYIHMNIPQYEFNYKQSFLVALYLSVMTINENLQNKTLDQMVEEISSLGFVGKKCEIEKMFKGYQNGEFCLIVPDMVTLRQQGSLLEEVDLLEEMNVIQGMVYQQQQQRLEKQFKKSCTLNRHALLHKNDENYYDHKSQHNHPHHHILHHRPTTNLSIPITKNYKLLFCKLDLANDDIQYELHRRQQIMSRKHQLLQQLKAKIEINGLFELFHKVDTEVNLQEIVFESVHERVYQPKSMQELQCMDKGDDLLNQPNTYTNLFTIFRLIQKLLQQTKFVSDFTNDKLTFQQLIDEIWQINSRDLKLHSQQVVQLVEDMKEQLGIGGCMIVNRNFLMIVVNKNRFSQLLCEVKHKMNRGQLKSKSLFRIDDQDLVQQRWASDKVIGEKIFSSVPASGVGIFDPSQAIWFD